MAAEAQVRFALIIALMAGVASADTFVARAISMPDTKPELAAFAALAAMMTETDLVPAEIMVAIAWGESRFDPTVRTGHVCGPMQTVPKVPSDCARWSNMLEGFRAGRDELEDELRHDPRVHGDLRLALLAYACGNAAFGGTCKKLSYPAIIFQRARSLGWRPRRATMI